MVCDPGYEWWSKQSQRSEKQQTNQSFKGFYHVKFFFTINTEGVFYFDWQGGVVTENRHHVQEVLKRHTAITGRRENLNDTLIERIHLKRYNSINSTLVWLCIYFLRWQMYTNLKAFFFASYMYDVPIQNYSSRVFPVDLGKRIFSELYTGKVLKVANCTFSGLSGRARKHPNSAGKPREVAIEKLQLDWKYSTWASVKQVQ